MGAVTHIQWTDATWNPWEGCTKVSPGCLHCYAETRNQRFSGGANWGKGKPRRRTSATNWKQPLKWDRDSLASEGIADDPKHHEFRRVPRVFCASLADWLDDEVPVEWLRDLLALIGQTPHLDWQLLTKRPENWRTRLEKVAELEIEGITGIGVVQAIEWLKGTARSNVWIGTSVEDQVRANLRIPQLLKIPAKVRFLSCEPLLEPLEFSDVTKRLDVVEQLGKRALDGIDWVIIGGESGHEARPFDLEWCRNIIAQCKGAGVPVFVKQLGALAYDSSKSDEDAAYITKHSKGGDPAEWPEELRVMQFPSVNSTP